MSVTIVPIKDTYHYFHKGVSSRPSWAYNDARQQIARKWADFLKAMPDTSNVSVQDVGYKDLGGGIARLGAFGSNITVTGAGSKTKGGGIGGSRSWTTWFDIHYELQLIFVASGQQSTVNTGLSIEEVNKRIAAAGV